MHGYLLGKKNSMHCTKIPLMRDLGEVIGMQPYPQFWRVNSWI